jgi:uncharacterized protein YdaU (DUF1376 family)
MSSSGGDFRLVYDVDAAVGMVDLMHYYDFNVADYRADTTHLTLLEHGIYRQLIDWYYLDEKPIPLSVQTVARRLGLGSAELQSLKNVLTDFFQKTETGYSHKRIEREIAHYRSRVAKNRINGQLGGRPRKNQMGSQALSEIEATIKPRKSQANLNQQPLTSNPEIKSLSQKTLSGPLFQEPDAFTQFWQAYPKKTGKGAALKAWHKLKPPLPQLLAALQWQKASKPWIEGYIPLPTTYLTQERWNDEPETRLGGGAAQEFYQAKPVQKSENYAQRLSQTLASAGIRKAGAA